MPVFINGFSSVKSYFFIINEVTPQILNELKDLPYYQYYGYDISRFNIKEKKYLFLTVILANLWKLKKQVYQW